MITVIFKPGLFRSGSTGYEEGPQFLSVHPYRLNSKQQSWRPPTDIYETEEQFIVLIEIAGMEESDFTVSIDHNILIVSGFRNSPLGERRGVHQMEIPFGDFIAPIELPLNIELEKTEADYDNGFLRINLPKEKPRRIEINKG